MPDQTSPLQSLLTTLGSHGTSFVLDPSTLAGPAAPALLALFSDDGLGVTSFSLDDVRLPPAVTGTTLLLSGRSGDVTLDMTFTDVAAEIAIDAVFRAAALAPLQQAFPALASDFFSGVPTPGPTAGVSVLGLGTVALTAPSYGVAGHVLPAGGLMTTSIAPRVDGQLAGASGSPPLSIELPTATTGYRVSAADGSTWTFAQLETLTGLGALAALDATVIPATNLRLCGFDLNLHPLAPDLSTLTLDVADADDATGRTTPLWTALDGHVELTDVLVMLDLTYSDQHVLGLAGTGWVEGRFKLGTCELDVQIPFPDPGVCTLAAYPNVALPGLDDIAALVAGNHTPHDLLPAGLAAIGSFELTYLRLAVNVKRAALVDLSVGLASSSPWTLVPGRDDADPAVQLSSLQIRLTIDAAAAVTGAVVGTVQLPDDGDTILVSFGRSTSQDAWRLDVTSPAIALPSLDQLARFASMDGLASKIEAAGLDKQRFVMTGLNLGLAFGPTKLTNLGFTLHLAEENQPLDRLDWVLVGPDVLTLTEFALGVQIDSAGTDTNTTVVASCVINGLEFDIDFVAGQGLVAEYTATPDAGTIDVKHLIAGISPAVAAAVPDGLAIELDDALLAYVSTGSNYVFAMDVGAELGLSNLPVVGKLLPPDLDLKLKNLKVVAARNALSAADVSSINGMSKARPVLPTAPANTKGDAIAAGASVVGELDLGSLVVQLGGPPAAAPADDATPTPAARSLTAAARPALAGASAPAAAPPSPATAPARSAAPAGLWKDVDLHLGPAELRRVGIAWQRSKLWLLIDAGFNAGGLAIDLQGLGLGVGVSDPAHTLEPVLHGLAVSFSEGPVQITGGLIEVDTDTGPAYNGEILIELEVLQIAALGSWATLEDGHPSLFVFAMLNEPPLGGPAFFYVTGLAFGFGYNRSLVLPALDQLPAFPFVAAAMADAKPGNNPFASTDPAKALEVLAGPPQYVPPTEGVNWLAAGVRFTSFELLQSFALVTVQFGRGFQVALLGLSTLTTPPDVPEPIVYAELALEASYSTETGLVAVSAELTPASYVLSGDCKLTGGFAFYLWTKAVADGPAAGEFVVTLGGYNPHFVAPNGYPTVPRVGINWRVSSELTVKGGLYLAVTPSCVMTGGSLEAAWRSGGLDVTFTAQADFVLGWQPFHYEAGASVTLTGRLQTHVIVTISITIHLGVWLELHGPPFGGQAHVDLDIVSFTVAFGADKPDRTPIPWSRFKSSFLPAHTAQQETWCGVRVVGGLESDLTKSGGSIAWVLNGEQLALQTFTVVPSTELWLATGGTGSNEQVGATPAKFGVGPVGVADGDLGSKHTVTLHRVRSDGTLDADTDVTTHLDRQAATAAQPRALWSVDAAMSDSVGEANKPATLPDMHTGLLLEAKPPAGSGPQVSETQLRKAATPSDTPPRWRAGAVATTRPAPDGGLAHSLEDKTAAARRAAIAAILDPSGTTLPLQPSTTLLAKDAATITGSPAYAAVGG